MNLDELYDEALQRYDGMPETFDGLPERDQVLITLWGLEADVNNGGFHQYFQNSSGDHAHFAVQALRTVGAAEMADVTERACAVFGTSGVPRDRNVRQAVLEQIEDACEDLFASCDAEFLAYPDDLRSLVASWVERVG